MTVEYYGSSVLLLNTIEHAIVLSQESNIYSHEVCFGVEISKVLIVLMIKLEDGMVMLLN